MMRILYILLLCFFSAPISAQLQMYLKNIEESVIADTLILDDFPGAVAAYSLRLMNSNYAGDCVRVRRSSDDTETDIGFLDGFLDTASMKTFVGAGNGFVSIWYSQVDSNDVTQASLSRQPQIISSGAIIRDSHGNPGLKFDGSNDRIQAAFTLNTPFHIFSVVEKTITGDNDVIAYDGYTGVVYLSWNINSMKAVTANSQCSFFVGDDWTGTKQF